MPTPDLTSLAEVGSGCPRPGVDLIDTAVLIDAIEGRGSPTPTPPADVATRVPLGAMVCHHVDVSGTLVSMCDLIAVTSASFQVGPKGRVVLPAAVRHAAGVEPGTTLVARTDARGRIILESPEALRERVWAAAPTSYGLDVTADVRAMRTEDSARADRVAAERAEAASGDDVGAALLKHLGL